MKKLALLFTVIINLSVSTSYAQHERPRIIITTDGEADDRASMVRLLLTANEFDIEGHY